MKGIRTHDDHCWMRVFGRIAAARTLRPDAEGAMVSGRRSKARRRENGRRLRKRQAPSRKWRLVFMLLLVTLLALGITCFWASTPEGSAAMGQPHTALGSCSIEDVGSRTGPPSYDPQHGITIPIESTSYRDCVGQRFTLAGITQLLCAGLLGAVLSVVLSWIPRRRSRIFAHVFVLVLGVAGFVTTLETHTTSITLPSGPTVPLAPWDVWQLQVVAGFSSIAVGAVTGVLGVAMAAGLQRVDSPTAGWRWKRDRA